jgi:Ca2+-binding EF-hand superfamily protein
MAEVVRGKIEAPSKVGATNLPGNPLNKGVYQVAVPNVDHELTADELDDIKQAFDLFDFNGTGTIKPRNVQLALSFQESDRKPSVFRLLEGIEELPEDIEYPEFLSHIVERLGNKKNRSGVEHIFKLYDYNATGTIDLPKFQRVTKELGQALPAETLEDALVRNSGSGQPEVSPDDFYEVMTKKFYA